MTRDTTPLTTAIRASLQARGAVAFTDEQIAEAAARQCEYVEEENRRERALAQLGAAPARLVDHPLDHVERYASAIAATMLSARAREQERDQAAQQFVEENAGMQLRARHRRRYP